MASPRNSQPSASARKPRSPRRLVARLLGHEVPRLFTLPLRELTPETSKGFAAIEFAETILELVLFPWQKWVLIHALELKPDGTYRFRTILLLVARQNGKSTLLLVLALWRMYVDGAPLVIGTAQNLDISEELWEQAVEIAQSIPELDELIKHVDKTNGKKALRLTTGERYKVAAASRRGGRGLSGDLVLLDELREHKTWDAWGAVTKTTMARLLAQVWAASNAGDLASKVLRHLRSLAHRALGWPDGRDGMVDLSDVEESGDDSLFLAEYSAKPGRGIWDREGWAEGNPSMNHPNGISEVAIAGAAATDPEQVFRTEVLCQQVDTLITGPISVEVWEANRAPGDVTPHEYAQGRIVVAAHQRVNREMQSLSIVAVYEIDVENEDTTTRYDVIDLGFYEATTEEEWPAKWAAKQVEEFAKKLGVDEVVIPDDDGGNALLITQLKKIGRATRVLKLAEDRAGAVGLTNGLDNGTVLHVGGQDDMTVAAVGARTSGPADDFKWSQATADVDLGPIRAASAGWWVLEETRDVDYDLSDSFA